MQKLPLAWLKGLQGKEKEDLEYLLRNNRQLINKLLELISEFESDESKSETSISDYDSPSWSHKQADRNGARRAYRKIRSLFSYMDVPS